MITNFGERSNGTQRWKIQPLTYTQDFLIRSASRLDHFDTRLHLLVGDRSNMRTEVKPLVNYGYLVKSDDGLTGTWYQVTPRGMAYLNGATLMASDESDRCLDCQRGRCCGNCGCCPKRAHDG